jgi:Zn-dependent peptidase ImmA (M78 family)
MIKFDLMDNFNRLFSVVEKEFGELNIEIALAEMDDDGEENCCLGQTDFDRKLILIHHDQTPTQMIDVIAHELAHVICGLESGHNDGWENTYGRIFTLYQEASVQVAMDMI